MPIVSITPEETAEQNDLLKKLYNSYSEESTKRGYPFSYSIRTFGCQLNESDSEKIAGFLGEMSFVPAVSDDPDLVIFNTCSVRENAEDRLFGNLGIVKAAKKKNPSMMIAVCGCMMKQPENVERIRKSFPYVNLVFGPQDIHRIPELFHKVRFSQKKLFDVSDIDYIADDLSMPVDRSRKFRALVPIMYGCNKFCTYCIVPYTRGRERSRPMEQILTEAKKLIAEGYKEIMLLGQNVNSYGNDLSEGEDFSALLEALAKLPGMYRIRFMTSHPKDLTNEVIDIMARYPNIERHLHLPVQSGSNRVLKTMNRHYTREDFLDTVRYYRDKIPGGTLSTDIIVGFPGETEEEFAETLTMAEEAAFDSAFTFQYSIRQGTPAAKMPDQIPHDVVTERFGRLMELQNHLCYQSNLAVVDTVEELLIEGRSETAAHIFTGRTSSNRLVNFTIPVGTVLPWGQVLGEGNSINGDELEGAIALVRLLRVRPFSCEGRLESFV